MFNSKYGHTKAKFGDHEFTLKPTFQAMSLIGNQEDIISVFSKLHCIHLNEYLNQFKNHSNAVLSLISKYTKKVTGPEQLKAAHLVLTCCSDEDLSPMIGKFIVKDRVYYQPGFAPIQNVIALAQHMMYHGMIGHTSDRFVKGNSEKSTTFEPSYFANLAGLKLNLSRSESWDLTMTEFIERWNIEFPPTDEEVVESITQDEYDAFWDNLESKS